MRNEQAITIATANTIKGSSFSAAPSHWIAESASEGAGQKIGNAVITIPLGQGRATSEDAWGSLQPLVAESFHGLYVRLSKDVESVSTPFWYGRVLSSSIEDQGGGYGVQRLFCEEIKSVLQTLIPSQGYFEDGVSFEPMGTLPPFNSLQPLGDMSVNTRTIAGRTVRVHFTVPGIADAWTARDAINYLFAIIEEEYGVVLNLIEQASCLGYFLENVDTYGSSIFDVLNELANPRRGLIWRLTPDLADDKENTFTVNVQSISTVERTDGSYTLPPAPAMVSINTTEDVFANPTIDIEAGSVFDRVRVVGGRPLVGITLCYDANDEDSSLIKGWTEAQETAWNLDPDDPEATGVWRDFILNPRWDWSQYDLGTVGLRNKLIIDDTGDFPILTGAREYDNMAPGIFVAYPLEITGFLPIGEGFDPENSDQQAAFAMLQDGGSWLDITGHQGGDAEYSLSVSTSDGRSVISLSGDRNRIASDLASSKLLVTVGMREPAPLQVESINSNYPSGRPVPPFPRTAVISEPSADEWIMLEGTVLGHAAGDTTTLEKVAEDIMVKDKTESITATAAQAMAFYGQPYTSVDLSVEGLIDSDAGRQPGTVINSVVTSFATIATNAYVVSRSWTFFADQMATVYETQRVTEDIEGVR